MLYSEVITEILTRADESYVDVSEARARQHFRGAVASLIKAGQYGDEDLLKMKVLDSYTFLGSESGEITLSFINSGNLLKLLDAFIDPEDSSGYILSKATLDEVKRYAYATNLRPSGVNIKYYQVGETLKFIPAATMTDSLVVYFVIITSPPVYDASPSATEWGPNTDMLTWFSYSFLMQAIEQAAGMFEAEVD